MVTCYMPRAVIQINPCNAEMKGQYMKENLYSSQTIDTSFSLSFTILDSIFSFQANRKETKTWGSPG